MRIAGAVIIFVILLLLIAVLILIQYVKRLRRDDIAIEAIYNASRRIPEMGGRTGFIKYVCELTKNITRADEFVYFKYNEKNKMLIPTYAESPYKEQIMNSSLKLGEGFTGKVAVSRKGGILNHANKSKVSKHVPNTPNEESSLLAMPMIFNRNLLGAILQVKLRGGVFKQKELKLSEIFVNMASEFFFTKDLLHNVCESVVQLIVSLVRNVEYKDPYTAGHSIRVGHFAEIISRGLGLDEKTVLTAKVGGFLHDIGKIAIEDKILKEKFILEDEDWEKVKEHPRIRAEIVGKFTFLDDMVPCILYHHKHYDGSGYPEDIHINGKEIPVCGRIIAVADTLDAITTSRPGYPVRSLQWAIMELNENKGSQFDPDIVKVVIENGSKIAKFVRKRFDIEDKKNYEEIAQIL